MSVTLRPYQRDALNDEAIVAILRRIATDSEKPLTHSAPLVVAPTGAGKTRMFAAVAKWCHDRRLRVVILVPRREILRQTVLALNEADPSMGVGQIAAGRPMTGDLIQVASIQTIVNRLAVCRRPDLIIVDEAHHSTIANGLGKILGFWAEVPRLGFSATPQRLDGVGMRALFDKLVQGPSLRWLVEEGFLAYPYVLQPPGAEGGEYHVTRGDFDLKEQEEVMAGRAIMGNVIAHYRQYLDGAPTICWCASIDNAKTYAEAFREAGYRAEAVWGNMPDDERDRCLGGLGDGSVQIVTFCDLIGEGVDIPAVTGVIMLRKTMSLSLCRQVIGRGLRPVYARGYPTDTAEARREAQKQGPKPRAIILDHVGNTTSTWGHGHPLTEPVWSLDSVKRKKGEKPPATVTCPKCYGVWPGRPRTCPACGYSFAGAEVEKRKAELVEIEGQLVEAGIERDEAEGLAAFVRDANLADAKTRQKMLLGKAFSLALDDHEVEEVRKRKISELAKKVGYSEDWTRWAWEFARKNVQRA